MFFIGGTDGQDFREKQKDGSRFPNCTVHNLNFQRPFLPVCVCFKTFFYRTDTVRLLLESHPELVGPFTAYGGAMYCHTPLHLASRNGHGYVKYEGQSLNKVSKFG